MSDLKLYLRPYFSGPDRGEGGIRRWVDAQREMLPERGITLAETEAEADVIACHAADLVDTRKPLVAHCHGLYHTGGGSWGRWEWMMNRNVIEVLRRSSIATAPSEWVRNQLARGMSLDARVLYAGIDPALFAPGVDGGYVLWNKTRVDAICDPGPLNRLAQMNPRQRFLTTFGDAGPNVQVTGKLSWSEARDLIQNAGVYLCTAYETFGIGTLEAMACAVPILGWAWGGQLDIVRHGEMGYLAEPGNYDDLQYGLGQCITNRETWGVAAREHVLATYTWDRAMDECANIYREAAEIGKPRPRVSVIVTCYKLEEYLPDCLKSLQAQTSTDWECIVCDDNSPGNCAEIVADFARADERFKYVKTPRNLFLAGARNYAIRTAATGRYIIPLDADDMLGDKSLEILGDFLDKQPGFAVAYGGFQLIEEDGRQWVSGWPQQTRWEFQMAHRNQLPYASLYRRQVWERVGGYRERCTTAEDADFWCRVLSYGFRAQKISSYPTLIYRNRTSSMSHTIPDPDWTAWYPWARHSHDSSLSRYPGAPVPFAAVGDPPNKISWPVETYDAPQVSVVIPVGPGHERLVIDALDSVVAQSYSRWEAIVVNDTGEPLELPGHPHARILETPATRARATLSAALHSVAEAAEGMETIIPHGGVKSTAFVGSGPAVARNLGIAASRGKWFVCLDADDYLMPRFLERCIAGAKETGGYVYTDWFQINQDGTTETKLAPDWQIMDLLFRGLQWTVTALIPKAAWEEAGGFDPACGGWEDWDLFFHLATLGYCGSHLPEPLFCYRYWSGQRREDGYARSQDNAAKLREKWHDYTDDGGKLMGCAGCGKGGGGRVTGRQNGTATMQQISRSEVTLAQATQDGAVELEFVLPIEGTRTYRGARSKQTYRFGNDSGHRRKFVYAVDAPALLALGGPAFRRVEPAPSPDAGPATEPLPVRQSANRVTESIGATG